MSATIPTTPTAAAPDGVDALALGDVNGDQVADIAVASHQGGHEYVTIYSGNGQLDPTNVTTATGYEADPLVTITDPLGPNSGPLNIALGDFAGTGRSQLAVAPSTASSSTQGRGITLFSFAIDGTSPVKAKVTASVVGSPFVPTGMNPQAGFALAAGDMLGNGLAELVVTPATGKASSIVEETYTPTTATWQTTQTIGGIPVKRGKGLSLAVGDLTGDGVTDIAVASESSGTVGLYSGKTQSWMRSRAPLGHQVQAVKVAIVTGINQPGALVETGNVAGQGAEGALWTWHTNTTNTFALPTSANAGSGTFTPLSGGMVYQRSSVYAVGSGTSQVQYSKGPVAPTVLFGATQGSSLVVQGFGAGGVVSTADTYVEPLWGDQSAGFVPLQSASDPALGDSSATTVAGSTALPAVDTVPTNLVVVPRNDYQSPYSITTLDPSSSVYQGMLPITPNTTTSPYSWGPTRTPNTGLTVTSATTTTDLTERLMKAYSDVIGLDYQHHYDPLWLPAQGHVWDAVSTVGYESQGIDCTNLTAWAYNDALGIKLNSDTGDQAQIAAGSTADITIPSTLNGLVTVSTIDKSVWTKAGDYTNIASATAQADYDKLVSLLHPGDILFIDGTAGKPTHAITWLGSYGVDANGRNKNLIVDATGITPDHVDSNNLVVPEGVHIRPFGIPSSENDWYFLHVDHVLRLIGT